MQLDQNLITNHTGDWLMNTDGVNPCRFIKNQYCTQTDFCYVDIILQILFITGMLIV